MRRKISRFLLKKIGNLLCNRYFDEYFINLMFERKLGRTINFQNPQTFNEKIQCLKIIDRNPLLTQCADKYEVRKFVEEKIGTHILNDLYGVFQNPNAIDYDSLPQSFVLKATHGSGWNIIVKDKSKLDKEKAIKQMKKWLSRNYYEEGREWSYKNILPQIICEKYMEDKNGQLDDYKFFCFNGNPIFIQVDLDRHAEHKRVFYSPEWKRYDFSLEYPLYEGEVKEPKSLKSMLKYAHLLSNEFYFARIDMYDFYEKPIFGEITFYPGCGYEKFSPEHWDAKFGKFLRLPVGNK